MSWYLSSGRLLGMLKFPVLFHARLGSSGATANSDFIHILHWVTCSAPHPFRIHLLIFNEKQGIL